MIPLSVKASGMVTAVGYNSFSSCAAIRAGISGISQDNIWDSGAGDYMGVGRPRMPQWWEGADMLAELSVPAIVECLNELPKNVDYSSVPIFVILSSTDRPFRESNLESIVFDEIEHRLRFKLLPGSGVFNIGRTGILDSLESISNMFTKQEAKYAIIVGVDTFLRQRVVDVFMDKRRILTTNNSNGFIPGEAACAVLIAPTGLDNDDELCILGWGRGHENGSIISDAPPKGEGLTHALSQALKKAGISMAETIYWLTDQNAEHYKFKECTIAQIRLERRDVPAQLPYEIWHPIEFLGEIGSAIGPCLLGLGFAAAKGGYAPGPLILMSVGEDTGERAALVLKWQEGD